VGCSSRCALPAPSPSPSPSVHADTTRPAPTDRSRRPARRWRRAASASCDSHCSWPPAPALAGSGRCWAGSLGPQTRLSERSTSTGPSTAAGCAHHPAARPLPPSALRGGLQVAWLDGLGFWGLPHEFKHLKDDLDALSPNRGLDARAACSRGDCRAWNGEYCRAGADARALGEACNEVLDQLGLLSAFHHEVWRVWQGCVCVLHFGCFGGVGRGSRREGNEVEGEAVG
jgi:hypothetical protein